VTNIGARELATANCDTTITSAVANIKQYNPTKVAAAACTDIQYCATGNFANIDCTTGSITTACATAAADTTNCGTNLVADCAQKACFKINGGNYADACTMCNSGKMPSAAGDILDSSASTTCGAGNVTDCDFYDITDTGKCYSCTAGTHVLETAQTTCTAYNATNHVQYCRINGTGSTNTECVACLQGYLFYDKLCVPAYQATPTPPNVLATSKCMGNKDGVTTCSSCYNYALGTIMPRQ
jgi:hypothetical protein